MATGRLIRSADLFVEVELYSGLRGSVMRFRSETALNGNREVLPNDEKANTLRVFSA